MSKIIVDEIQTNTVNGNVRIIPNGTGELEVTGNCSATTFSGSGANLTNVPAANLTGTIPNSSVPNPLPVLDGSALTGVGGGGWEFVKEISPSSSVTSITETGLDYDKIYKLVIKKLRIDGAQSELVWYPHMDNSSTEFDWSASPYNYQGQLRYNYINNGGVNFQNSYDDYWQFETSGYPSEYYGGSVVFGTTDHPWIIGNLQGNADRSWSQLQGKKARANNTNQDSNQTGTYSKMNGFTLKLYQSYWASFHQDTLFYLYKATES